MNDMVIKKNNILDKACFALFESGFKESHERLKEAMNKFRPTYAGLGAPFSHQKIQNWCDRGQHPNKPESFAFIQAFLESEGKTSALNAEQQKVYKQIVAFCKYCITTSNPSRKVYADQFRRIFIRGTQNKSDIEILLSRLPGMYLTYRMRFTELDGTPVAQELLQIVELNGELRFEHWFRTDENAIDKVQGNILLVGDVIWFVGITPSTPERLRVMHFKHIKSKNPTHSVIRWGLLASDIPEPSHEPVSCRIVIEKIKRSGSDEISLDESVTFPTKDELLKRGKGPMWRMIENNVTAHSIPRSFVPVIGKEDKPIVDELLTVDQRTVEAVAKALFPEGVVAE